MHQQLQILSRQEQVYPRFLHCQKFQRRRTPRSRQERARKCLDRWGFRQIIFNALHYCFVAKREILPAYPTIKGDRYRCQGRDSISLQWRDIPDVRLTHVHRSFAASIWKFHLWWNTEWDHRNTKYYYIFLKKGYFAHTFHSLQKIAWPCRQDIAAHTLVLFVSTCHRRSIYTLSLMLDPFRSKWTELCSLLDRVLCGCYLVTG